MLLLLVGAVLLGMLLYGTPADRVAPFFYGYMALAVVLSALGAWLYQAHQGQVVWLHIFAGLALFTALGLAGRLWSLWPAVVVGSILVATFLIYIIRHPSPPRSSPPAPLTLRQIVSHLLLGYATIGGSFMFLRIQELLIAGNFSLYRLFWPLGFIILISPLASTAAQVLTNGYERSAGSSREL